MPRKESHAGEQWDLSWEDAVTYTEERVRGCGVRRVELCVLKLFGLCAI